VTSDGGSPPHSMRLGTPTESSGRKNPMSMIPFDDHDGFVWYDGWLVPRRDANLHVLTHL
jgi:branched-chain amino acid aminotransferase